LSKKHLSAKIFKNHNIGPWSPCPPNYYLEQFVAVFVDMLRTRLEFAKFLLDKGRRVKQQRRRTPETEQIQSTRGQEANGEGPKARPAQRLETSGGSPLKKKKKTWEPVSQFLGP
jgi:hypothetical protein